MTYKEYGKDFQLKPSDERFFHSFTRLDGFMNEKLFQRYVSKIQTAIETMINRELEEKISIYDFMITEFMAQIEPYLKPDDDADFEELDEDCLDDEEDFDDWTLEYCPEFGSIEDFLTDEHHFQLMEKLADNFSWIHPRLFNAESDEEAMNEIARTIFAYDFMLSDENFSEDARGVIKHNYDVIISLLREHFNLVCLEYLTWRISEEKSTINSDNFVIHGQPKGNGELLFIIARTMSEAWTDILNSNQPSNILTEEESKYIKGLKGEIQELKLENEDLEAELDEIQERNQTLQRRLSDFNSRKEKEFESIKKENELAQIEINRLTRKNNLLEEENARLKAQLAEQPQQIIIQQPQEEILPEIDVMKRYVFVMDGNPYGEAPLLKAFPNATIISDNVPLNAKSVDAVICITRRVKHCIYESIKGQCETKNIPFIHCMQNNVEMVKNAIRKADL